MKIEYKDSLNALDKYISNFNINVSKQLSLSYSDPDYRIYKQTVKDLYIEIRRHFETFKMKYQDEDEVIEKYKEKLLKLKEIFSDSMKKDKNGIISERDLLLNSTFVTNDKYDINKRDNLIRNRKETMAMQNLVKSLNEQIKLSETTYSELAKSSSMVSSTKNELMNMIGSVDHAKKLASSFKKQQIIDFIIFIILFLIFIGVIIYIVLKRIKIL